MDQTPLYLKPNVVPEPLFNRWYAWSHLISPATAAMNIKGRHLKILESYIQSPMLHAAAVKNPKMIGGPFVDLGGGKVEEIKKLREKTVEENQDLLDFAAAITELNKMLAAAGDGSSLEKLYAKVPEPLQGYVELVYDLQNRPSFRLIESLLYLSPLYKPQSQSVALYIMDDDQRPFVLSTPRVDDQPVVHLTVPFASKAWDSLFDMKRRPGNFEKICAELGVPDEEKAKFRSFFTETPPPPYKKYTGDRVRMRYFGHACILLESAEVSILADPVISYYGYPSDVNRFTYFDLPEKIDYVLITHNHQDHILIESLLQLRTCIGAVIVPKGGNGSLQDPSLKQMFRQLGFNNVIEIDEMETLDLGDIRLTGLPFMGEHCDLNIPTKMVFLAGVGDFKIMLAADSCNIAPRIYEHVHKAVGDVDVLFLGMECEGAPVNWLYGPLLDEQLPREKDYSRRLAGSDYEQGMDLVDRFHPKEVYVYAMGQEPWLNYVMGIKYTDESKAIVHSNKLLDACRSKGIEGERLFGEKEILYSVVKEKVS